MTRTDPDSGSDRHRAVGECCRCPAQRRDSARREGLHRAEVSDVSFHCRERPQDGPLDDVGSKLTAEEIRQWIDDVARNDGKNRRRPASP